MKRSRYSWGVDGDYIVILDGNGPVSVTNDAEHVIQDLVRDGVDVDSKRVVYRDTDGTWDGLLTERGEFRDFLHLRAGSLIAAKAGWEKARAEQLPCASQRRGEANDGP